MARLQMLKPALTIVVLASSFAAGFVVQGWRKDAQIAEIEATNAAAVAAQVTQAMEETNRLQKVKDEALRRANVKATQNAAAADAARNELDRVRQQTDAASTAMSNATCTSIRNYATTLNSVFGECTATLEELARKADGHALDQRTLSETFPRNKQ